MLPFPPLFQIVWDDEEERRYREWLREFTQRRDSEVPLDWNEYQGEEEYRARLRQQVNE